MDSDTLRKLHGAAQLTTEAVEAAISGIEKVQRSITRQVYAPLIQSGPISPPARAVSQMQEGITTSIYQVMRKVNRVAGTTTVSILERLAQQQPTTNRTTSVQVETVAEDVTNARVKP